MLIAGATAAIALPPQMAVPAEIRCPVFVSNFRVLVRIAPSTKVKIIEHKISGRLAKLTDIAVCRCIPKPSPIIE